MQRQRLIANSRTLGKTPVDLGPGFFSLESGATMSSGEYADEVRARPAWRSIYSPESTQSSHFREMSTISAFRNVNTLNWRSSPELLGKVNQRKGDDHKESDLRPREVISAHEFQVLQNRSARHTRDTEKTHCFLKQAWPQRITAPSRQA